MSLRIDSQEKRLDRLLTDIGQVTDEELKSHLSRYFCIQISGYLENVVKSLLESYCEKKTPKPIADFIQNSLQNVTNLSKDKLCKFLKKFSDDWETKFIDKVTDQQISSLNSIITNRNNIAHGKQDSISYVVVKKYYEDLKGIIAVLKLIIKK